VAEVLPEVAAAPSPVVDEEEEALPAFVEPEPEAAPAPTRGDDLPRRKPPVKAAEGEDAFEEEGEGTDVPAKKGKGKKKKRQLFFDEDRGEVVAKRNRKGSRQRDWEDYLD
jgi:hypothetical protein